MIGSKILTSSPFPPRNSASSTYGLSRRSSVCGLKLRPSNATTRSPESRIRRVAERRCDSLLRMTPFSIGRSTSAIRAMCIRARRSFGRHDPPNEKPGRRYAGETLRWRSSQNTRMTSRASTSTAERRRPISFANVIFTAWYALHAYLSDSAASIESAWTGCSIAEKRPVTSSSVAVVPDAGGRERRGEEVGDAASFAEELGDHADAERRRRLARPTRRSRIGRSAAVDRSRGDGAAVDDREERRRGSAMTAPSSSVTRSTKPRSTVPSLRAGVPTDTRTTSASRGRSREVG